jgi:copper chaperone
MIEFDLQAMSCGHCASTVTKTIQSVDPAARVEVNLDTKKVKVESSAPRESLAGALTEAGYPPANG